MVKSLFDNRFALTYVQTKNLLYNLFNVLLPTFAQDKSDNFGMSYSITYKFSEISFNLKSERGYLDYDLIVNGEKIDLTNYETQISKIEVTSEKNITFLIKTVSNFLEENKFISPVG